MSREPKRDASLTDWLGVTDTPNWRVARLLGPFLSVVLLLLFSLAVVAAGVVLIKTVSGGGATTLGAGALVAAMLGGPFVIWGTVLKHQTVMYQKEGHITDRINKAVEQLGAEKTVDRIGRTLHVYRDQLETVTQNENQEPPNYSIRLTDDLLRSYETLNPPKKSGQATFRTWKSEEHLIQYKDESLSIPDRDHLVSSGTWQKFSETVPNIEVRVGAILSLERIAQDSTRHDKGRDQVRVMEILCAYVRENSNARKPIDYPGGDWKPLRENASEEERAWYETRRTSRFGPYAIGSMGYNWARRLPEPRIDITLAVQVIARRTPEQRRVEANWPNRGNDIDWPFSQFSEILHDQLQKLPTDAAEFLNLHSLAATLRKRRYNYQGYRIDLSGANLQGISIPGEQHGSLDLSGANLSRSRLEGASLRYLKLVGADLTNCKLIGANLVGANLSLASGTSVRLEAANLSHAIMRASHWGSAGFEGAQLREARLELSYMGGRLTEGANLLNARLQGAEVLGAKINRAILDGACFDGAKIWFTDIGEQLSQKSTSFRYACFIDVDLTHLKSIGDQLSITFGDASVVLPGDRTAPEKWPKFRLANELVPLDPLTATNQYLKWLSDTENYEPPSPT